MESKTYVQEGYNPPESGLLKEGVYRQVLPMWVKACVDAVLTILTPSGVKMVIAKRKLLPQKDWWIFGGRILVSDGGLREALLRKLKEEIGLNIQLDRIPESPTRLHFMKWGDDGSVIPAPAFFVNISNDEYVGMLTNLPVSPEYSELKLVSPVEVRDSEAYHPTLRDCARTLIEQEGV